MTTKPEPAESEVGGLNALSEGRRKRIFVQLAAAAAVLIAAILSILAFFMVRQADLLRGALVFLLQAGTATLLGIAALSLGAIVILIVTGVHSGHWERVVRPMVVRLMLPLAVGVGRLIGISRDEVQGSFLSVNNALIGGRGRTGLEASEILVLLPRCLQWADCPHKVSQEVHRCQRCGRCSLGAIVEETESLGVATFVSTGGTQARRLVKELRPKVIVAVACERELTEGIRDVGNIPVVAVINSRPEGPCFNTDVDPGCVTLAIRELIEEGVDSERVPV